VKTGVKAGSVVIVEDIVLLNDAGLTVKTWVGIVRRWAKFDKICSLTQSGLVDMMVVRGWSYYQVAYYGCTANFKLLFWKIPTQFGE
jgi:hypothetical protein